MKKIYNSRYANKKYKIKYYPRSTEVLPEYLRAYYFNNNDFHYYYLIKESHICLPMFFKYNIHKYSYIAIKDSL